jgi:hypothetical protein
MKMRARLFITIFLCLVPFSTSAGAALAADDELRVYLMTFSPGAVIYERFGHNVIVIHDPNPSIERMAKRAGLEDKYGTFPRVRPFDPTDRAHHYGAFDFGEGFIPRFVMGRMVYWTASDWADLTALAYANENRTVLLQELNLTPAQKVALKDFLETNELPENRNYRYDYYRDNCSTRVRDAIDRVTGGELKRQLAVVTTGATYRSHTRRLTSGLDPLDVWWFTAFTYVLGHPVDEPLSAWEECFIPEKLAEHVRNVTVPDGSTAGRRPLVLSEQMLSSTTRAPMPEIAPKRIPGYLAAGLLFGGAFAGLAWLSVRSRAARVGYILLIVPWALMWGVGGLIAANGWAVTDHAASYRNENLMQFSPLILPLAVLGPTLAAGRRRGAQVALVLAITIAALSVLGLLLKMLPAFWQHNGEILALAVPSNLGLAVGMLFLARRTRGAAAPPIGQPPEQKKRSKRKA